VVEEYVKHLASATNNIKPTLTEREREVLQLVAEGESTKEIAAKLHVSTKAIEATRRKIMEKLGIYNVAELTKYAIGEGLTSVDL
jgi:DNA-binding NarL/FixJ family response regulator